MSNNRWAWSSFLRGYINYLLLHMKTPPKLSDIKQQEYFIIFIVSVSQKTEQGRMETAALCPMMSKASAEGLETGII